MAISYGPISLAARPVEFTRNRALRVETIRINDARTRLATETIQENAYSTPTPAYDDATGQERTALQ
ncbi:hypothetical protein NTCA1_38560 [Novosphingobium sp. TCA1]|nr:hypothetical protein NTCA1_38560 [Novosphingobium sp. TCA1]